MTTGESYGFLYGYRSGLDGPNVCEIADLVGGLLSWRQADWYVSWATGDDRNDGKTPQTPVKTVMGGIARKWACISPILAQDTRIHILDSQPLGAEDVTINPTFSGPFSLTYVGTPIAVGAPFAAGAVTARNRATKQPLTVNLTAHAGGAPPRGTMIVNTTRGNSYAFCRDAAGLATVMSQPLAPVPLGGALVASVTEVNTWAPGDVLQAFTLPTINLSSSVANAGPVNGGKTGSGVRFTNLKLLDSSGTPGGSTFAPAAIGSFVLFDQCWTECFLLCGALPSYTTLLGVYAQGGWQTFETAICGGVLTADSIGGSCGHGSVLDADLVIEGFVQVNGAITTLGDIEIPTNGGINVNTPGCFLVAATQPEAILWGDGGLDIEGGGALKKVQSTWAASLFLSFVTIEGQATATGYAAGVFTDGIAITPAQLDARKGLQDVITGSRLSS